jgi:RecA-family ATPase
MLEDRAGQDRPALIVLDTLADLFPGDENSKLHTRQFVTLLRRLALGSEAAVVVLAHPSVAGMASGFGTSGNTAWNNSVRSRLYLERIFATGKDGKLQEPDPTMRTLSNKKLNYGPSGTNFRLRWLDGVFVTDDRLTLPAPAVEVEPDTSRAEEKFLELLAAFTAEGRKVSATPSGSYAPSLFAKDVRSDGVSKQAFAKAMSVLFSAKAIVVEEHGPPSHRRSRIVLAPSNDASNAPSNSDLALE